MWLFVSEVKMALVSCQQATCRARELAAVGVPLPCPAVLRLPEPSKSLVAEIRSQIAESVVQHRAEACDHDPSPKTELETLTLPLTLTLALTITPGRHVRLHLGGNSGNYRKGKRYA